MSDWVGALATRGSLTATGTSASGLPGRGWKPCARPPVEARFTDDPSTPPRSVGLPKISEFFGIDIYMYFEDHPPPHFHAQYA
jgi:hypothetical protein